MLEDARYYATHPIALASAGVGALGSALGAFDPLLTSLAATSGMWFPAATAFSRFVAPGIDWISSTQAQTILMVAGAVFVVVMIDRLIDRLQEDNS